MRFLQALGLTSSAHSRFANLAKGRRSAQIDRLRKACLETLEDRRLFTAARRGGGGHPAVRACRDALARAFQNRG